MNLLQLLSGLRPVSRRAQKAAIDGIILDAVESDALTALHERRPVWLTWRRWETWTEHREIAETYQSTAEEPADSRAAVEQAMERLGWEP